MIWQTLHNALILLYNNTMLHLRTNPNAINIPLSRTAHSKLSIRSINESTSADSETLIVRANTHEEETANIYNAEHKIPQ